MSNPISFCDSCYPASYAECEDIVFVVGLGDTQNYQAIITNSFGQKYTQDVTTDTGGAFSLDISLFPDGFFNPFAGFFTLTVEAGGVIQDLTIMYNTYECVSFDIYSLTDAN